MAQLFEPMACVLSDTDLEMLVFLTSVVVTPVAESQLPGGNLPFMLQSKVSKLGIKYSVVGFKDQSPMLLLKEQSS